MKTIIKCTNCEHEKTVNLVAEYQTFTCKNCGKKVIVRMDYDLNKAKNKITVAKKIGVNYDDLNEILRKWCNAK